MPPAHDPQSGLLDKWGRRNRKHHDQACAACGRLFHPQRKASRFCSRPCQWSKNGGQNKKDESWWTNQKGYIEGSIWEDGKQRRVKQHRLVVERAIGRTLLPTEDVHHENEIKSDNSSSNLAVLPHGHHSVITNERRWARVRHAKATGGRS